MAGESQLEYDKLPDVSYGDEPPTDWRDMMDDDVDPDDEELDKTPKDVVELLGFDPKDLD